MAISKLPTATPQISVSTYELQRIQDNVTQVLDAILQTLNGGGALGSDGQRSVGLIELSTRRYPSPQGEVYATGINTALPSSADLVVRAGLFSSPPWTMQMKMPAAGSVVGMYGGIRGTPYDNNSFTLCKNQVATSYVVTNPVLAVDSAVGPTMSWHSPIEDVGTYPFDAGDVLSIRYSGDTAHTPAYTATLAMTAQLLIDYA